LPEEQEEFKLAQKGLDLDIAKEEFLELMRTILKYDREEEFFGKLSDKERKLVRDVLEKIREEFIKIHQERELL
jgi:hypothetical protein